MSVGVPRGNIYQRRYRFSTIFSFTNCGHLFEILTMRILSHLVAWVLLVAFCCLRSCTCLAPSSSVSGRQRRQSQFPQSRDATETDVEVMRCQIGQFSPGDAAIGVPSSCRCQHGFPQVFAMDPFPNGKRLNSGLLKLTCPLLVRAIDDLEDDGFISQFNNMVSEGSNDTKESALQTSIREAHSVHASVRHRLIGGQEEKDLIRAKIGEPHFLAFMSAGVAGASPDAVTDVKCLHAWLGDYLFRGPEESPVGTMVARVLNERGVDERGTINCRQYCDASSEVRPKPPEPRNRQRKRTSKELARRRRSKHSGERV